MHINRQRQNETKRKRKNVIFLPFAFRTAYFPSFFFFFANSVPPSNVCTLHSIRMAIVMREKNESKANVAKSRKTKWISFKIQIKYKFAVAYCLLLLLWWFGGFEIEKLISNFEVFFFWFFTIHSFLSFRFVLERNFISKIKRTHECVLLLAVFLFLFFLFFFFFVNYLNLLMCGIWYSQFCVRFALTARVWLPLAFVCVYFLYIFVNRFELHQMAEWMSAKVCVCSNSYFTCCMCVRARARPFV